MRMNDYDALTQVTIIDIIEDIIDSGQTREYAERLVNDLISGVKKYCYKGFREECQACPLKKDEKGNPIDCEAKLSTDRRCCKCSHFNYPTTVFCEGCTSEGKNWEPKED